jgi:hypothetical protein
MNDPAKNHAAMVVIVNLLELPEEADPIMLFSTENGKKG